MSNNCNWNKILNRHVTEMILQQLRNSGESLFFQHQIINEHLAYIDPNKQPKQYKLINSLALKILEVSELTIKCVNEFEDMDLQIILEGEA